MNDNQGKTQAEINQEEIVSILRAELRHELSYDQANEKLQVVVDRINKRGAEIHAKYKAMGMKKGNYSPITVGYVRRATDL